MERNVDSNKSRKRREYKYPTYKELFEAFRRGELKDYVLRMDNDYCCLSYIGSEMDEDEASEHCADLFRGGGYVDVVEMLVAAGIPCESV